MLIGNKTLVIQQAEWDKLAPDVQEAMRKSFIVDVASPAEWEELGAALKRKAAQLSQARDAKGSHGKPVQTS